MRMTLWTNKYIYQLKKHQKENDRVMKELMFYAMLAWYEATWKAIPVDTGMARASLIPMARQMGYAIETIIPNRESHEIDEEIVDRYIHPVRRMKYGIEEAEREPAFRYDNEGRAQRFSYDIPVYHWSMLDSEWHALAQGEIAFWDCVHEFRNTAQKMLEQGFKKNFLKKHTPAIRITGTTKLERLFEIRGMAERGEL